MRLTMGPPTSTSPSPPDEVMTTSSVVSRRPYPETPPPLIAAPVPIPSVCAIHSLPRQPRPPKTIIPGLSWTLLLPPPLWIIDGISTMTAAYPCAVGSASINVLSSVRRRRALWTSTIGPPGDRERFLESADAHLGVHGHDELPRELQPFTPDCRESCHRECKRVDSRPQFDDSKLAGFVGRGGSDFLNQRRTRRFHGDAGQDCTRCIPDNAGHRRLLSKRCGRDEDEEQRNECHVGQITHDDLLPAHAVTDGTVACRAVRN